MFNKKIFNFALKNLQKTKDLSNNHSFHYKLQEIFVTNVNELIH